MPIDADLEENLKAPKKALADGELVEQHNLKDQLAVANYLNSAAVDCKKTSGVCITTLAPGSNV